jgi:hypothetical protein
MLAILHLLVMFGADIFKSRRRLEAENLFLRHQLNVALRRAAPRLRLHGSDRPRSRRAAALAVNLVTLRQYDAARDEAAAIALWLRTWQKTYPDIDFAGRLAWWRGQWRDHLVPKANIVVAEALEQMVGFVTVEPGTHYLDQLVVAPEFWGHWRRHQADQRGQAHFAARA